MDSEGLTERVDAKGSGRDGATDERVVDPFDLATPIVSETRKRGLTREQAIAEGAKLGADTARQRGETGELAMERVERAKAYAAWDYDGRPTSGVGVKVPPVADFKKERK